jgi:hypothetical protein
MAKVSTVVSDVRVTLEMNLEEARVVKNAVGPLPWTAASSSVYEELVGALERLDGIVS